MNIILIKLLIAHLLGDFFLQPGKWVSEKETKKLKSGKLYLHILIHGFLLTVLLWNLSYWREIIGLMLFHGIIDILKLLCQNEKTKRAWFFSDQILHLATILLVWYYSWKPDLDMRFFEDREFWTKLLAVIFLTFPSSIIIKMSIAKWTPSYLSANAHIREGASSLQSAGKYIGIMERLLVFLFACINHWEAVGFLIAAKSIFRFGDLKEGNDLQLTEYILIGTLLSFGIAISTAMLTIELLKL